VRDIPPATVKRIRCPLHSPNSVASHLRLGIRPKSKDGLVFVVCKSRQDDDDNQQHVRIVPVIGLVLSDLAVAFGVLLNTAYRAGPCIVDLSLRRDDVRPLDTIGLICLRFEAALQAAVDSVEININHRHVAHRNSVPLLAGSEVHFVDDLMGASFRVVNPNATGSCGCGTSFSI
jgi:hypothetical protein